MRSLIFILALTVINSAFAQDNMDSILSLSPNRFFNDLLNRKGKVNVLAGGNLKHFNIKSEILKNKGYELIKTLDKNLYIHIWSTGRLYMLDKTLPLDSTLVFRRIDNTWNFNYNIGSYLFSSKNKIYEIGGYGFWKSNGILRIFNTKNKEWDVVVTNKEIFIPYFHPAGNLSWIDTSETHLYIPFEQVSNDGLSGYSDGGVDVLQAYRLDIAKSHWEKLGDLSPEIFKIFKNSSIAISGPNGFLLGYTSKVYWLNYLTNEISVNIDPVLAQTLSRIEKEFLYYQYRGWVYWYDPRNDRYDSLHIDYASFSPNSKPIWKKGISRIQLAAMGFLLVILMGGLVWWKFGKKKRQSAIMDGDSLAVQAPFTATEASLLELLIKKTKAARTASIDEINYVLGTKEKNSGMQKKVRSDILNSVNEKFRLLNGSQALLIQSIRSESDKRYFEYKINNDLLASVEAMLG